MSKFLDKYFKEPYINVICVELGESIKDYKSKRNMNILIGVILAAIIIFAGIVLKSIILIIAAVVIAYFFYRKEYLRIKRKERATREELIKIYPILVQTFISLLYTNDNLIKVFLLLENYHFHPYIDRALVIMINKYQLNPENSELIFAEFCNIFETSSASLLHQLLVNISRYGVNDDEIALLESKVEQECDKYIVKKTQIDCRKILQYGNVGVTAFVALLLALLVSSI